MPGTYHYSGRNGPLTTKKFTTKVSLRIRGKKKKESFSLDVVQHFTRRIDKIIVYTCTSHRSHRSFSRSCIFCACFHGVDLQGATDLFMILRFAVMYRGYTSYHACARVCKHIVRSSGTICQICTRFQVIHL